MTLFVQMIARCNHIQAGIIMVVVALGLGRGVNVHDGFSYGSKFTSVYEGANQRSAWGRAINMAVHALILLLA